MTAGPGWRHSPSKRAQAALIPLAVWPVVEFLGASYRWRIVGREHLARLAAAKQPHILAFWHGRILEAMLGFRDKNYAALISENFDGEWIARVAEHFGFTAVRGSSSRGGARALAELRRVLAQGRNVLFTPDGPRGPARVAQPGAVWLAGATGCPIVPVRLEADRARTIKSWDAHQLPSPGATITVVIDAPIDVPRDLDHAALEEKRRQLEQSLNAPVRV